MARRGATSTAASTKERRATTPSTFTGSSPSPRRSMTHCIRAVKWRLSWKGMSAYMPATQHALARRWPRGLANSGRMCCMSMFSSCSA